METVLVYLRYSFPATVLNNQDVAGPHRSSQSLSLQTFLVHVLSQ